jgi:poly(hydroxyalkanoate) depolymerase family esterase
MFARLLLLLARLRTWLQVRLGLWRGRWRRRQVSVPSARLFPGPLASAAWSYGLYCPAGLRDDTPAPLVLLLHGCRQRALGFAVASGFTRAADAQRFRLLCPQQRRRANLWRCWNWFTPAAQRGAGELDTVRAMLDDVTATAGIAVSSVGVVGLSAGGALAALLAFHAADRVAAVVTVAAPPLLGRINMQDPRDVMKRGLALPPVLALTGQSPVAPLMVVQGRVDPVVAPICGEQLVEQACRAHERRGASLQAGAPQAEAGAQVTDHRAGDALALRVVWIDALGHAWSGATGGHPYVEQDGDRLTARALQFLRDTQVLH